MGLQFLEAVHHPDVCETLRSYDHGVPCVDYLLVRTPEPSVCSFLLTTYSYLFKFITYYIEKAKNRYMSCLKNFGSLQNSRTLSFCLTSKDVLLRLFQTLYLVVVLPITSLESE